jgi:hypothetical protein
MIENILKIIKETENEQKIEILIKCLDNECK